MPAAQGSPESLSPRVSISRILSAPPPGSDRPSLVIIQRSVVITGEPPAPRESAPAFSPPPLRVPNFGPFATGGLGTLEPDTTVLAPTEPDTNGLEGPHADNTAPGTEESPIDGRLTDPDGIPAAAVARAPAYEVGARPAVDASRSSPLAREPEEGDEDDLPGEPTRVTKGSRPSLGSASAPPAASPQSFASPRPAASPQPSASAQPAPSALRRPSQPPASAPRPPSQPPARAPSQPPSALARPLPPPSRGVSLPPSVPPRPLPPARLSSRPPMSGGGSLPPPVLPLSALAASLPPPPSLEGGADIAAEPSAATREALDAMFEDIATTGTSQPPAASATGPGASASADLDLEPAIAVEELAADELAPVELDARPVPPPAPALAAPRPPPAPPGAARPTPPAVPPPAAPEQPAAATDTAEPPRRRKRARVWWEDFFNDDYLRTVRAPSHAQVVRQCNFLEYSLGLQKGATILDVGCGLGLQAVELAARGYLVVGLDLSLPMLSRAADEAQDRDIKMNFLHGDMREMTFDGAFDAVVCLGTTFGYFDDDTNRQVLERMKRALKPQGLLLLDVVNRDFVVQGQPNLVWFEGDGCICMEETQFNDITSRLHVKRTVILEDGRQRENEYAIRLYPLHEIGQVMHQMGFRVAEVSGMEATPGVYFGATSPRLILLAERRVERGGTGTLPGAPGNTNPPGSPSEPARATLPGDAPFTEFERGPAEG